MNTYIKLIYQYSDHFSSSNNLTLSDDKPRRLLQGVLTKAIKAFPNNAIFLSVYFNQEIHGRISIGLNPILEEALQKY